MGPVEVWNGDGVPPGCGQTNKLKLLPSLFLRMRAVMNVLEVSVVCNFLNIFNWNPVSI